MSQKTIFHQALHCLLSQNLSSEKEIHFLKLCDSTIYKMNIVCGDFRPCGNLDTHVTSRSVSYTCMHLKYMYAFKM